MILGDRPSTKQKKIRVSPVRLTGKMKNDGKDLIHLLKEKKWVSPVRPTIFFETKKRLGHRGVFLLEEFLNQGLRKHHTCKRKGFYSFLLYEHFKFISHSVQQHLYFN